MAMEAFAVPDDVELTPDLRYRTVIIEIDDQLVNSWHKAVDLMDHYKHSRASRGFHATGVKRMSGHGHDEPYYLHAKHMYNLHRMKHQKLTAWTSVLGAAVEKPCSVIQFLFAFLLAPVDASFALCISLYAVR
ncbi:hypothetical protein TRIUR3_22589 [Triticum urartu]|uniref:Uncharacterized protein n=1 Tax=Triticum urartu TaxID=4572 RepID=M8A4U8_TRIUA|nr:hypothetical protein TRIUR3_22589 [Triticum urartu]